MTFHSQTPDILNPRKFQRFHVSLNEYNQEFKIEVRKSGENVTFMERSWEKASLPWSNLTTVSFSEYAKHAVYFKHKVKGRHIVGDRKTTLPLCFSLSCWVDWISGPLLPLREVTH